MRPQFRSPPKSSETTVQNRSGCTAPPRLHSHPISISPRRKKERRQRPLHAGPSRRQSSETSVHLLDFRPCSFHVNHDVYCNYEDNPQGLKEPIQSEPIRSVPIWRHMVHTCKEGANSWRPLRAKLKSTCRFPLHFDE